MTTARIDKDGYPTEASLKEIRGWPYPASGGYSSLFDFIEPIFEEYGKLERDGKIVTLVTGGWSGCEDAIGALQFNISFWSMCWESSHRGGMYKFVVFKGKPQR